jgi:hypothetical protein
MEMQDDVSLDSLFYKSVKGFNKPYDAHKLTLNYRRVVRETIGRHDT